ncbi:MAG TPA: DNA polymerase III subunit delta [Gemmatimonadales bacterium]|jgi:DNA polymerase-3 subunit delta|nr:DNA polymerase III subunit delta [Gemmatimonadales bacterium]
MPAYTLDALLRSLAKGELAPVYYLHGPEDVLKDEAVRAVVDRALDPGVRDFNFDQRSAGQLDPEAIFTLCTTLPMMAERRVVVLREVEGWKRRPKTRLAFLKYLERPAVETVVLLVQSSAEEDPDKDLVRGAYAVACEPLPPERARKWLLRRASALEVTLEAAAADHLLEAVGGDLGAVAAELQKFAALPAGAPLTAEQVGALVGVRHGETIYDWRDAVFDGHAGRAVALLPSILDQPGVSGVKLTTLMGSTLVGVGIARSHYDRGLRGAGLQDLLFKTLLRLRIFGLPDYKKESARWARWAATWPAARIRAGLSAARDTDQGIKSTTISDECGLLTDLVLRVTVPFLEAA